MHSSLVDGEITFLKLTSLLYGKYKKKLDSMRLIECNLLLCVNYSCYVCNYFKRWDLVIECFKWSKVNKIP